MLLPMLSVWSQGLNCPCVIWYLQEVRLDHVLQSLATHVAPVYQRVAPDSFRNQVGWTFSSIAGVNLLAVMYTLCDLVLHKWNCN